MNLVKLFFAETAHFFSLAFRAASRCFSSASRILRMSSCCFASSSGEVISSPDSHRSTWVAQLAFRASGYTGNPASAHTRRAGDRACAHPRELPAGGFSLAPLSLCLPCPVRFSGWSMGHSGGLSALWCLPLAPSGLRCSPRCSLTVAHPSLSRACSPSGLLPCRLLHQ